MNLNQTTLVLTILAAVAAPKFGFSQGSLTPPGPPAPMMKSLDQIEARTPITNTTSTVTLSLPGSYYLTQNLTVTGDGIDILTNDVTLDLNGFTVSSVAGTPTGNGIWLAGSLRNITIKNGFIQSGSTNDGTGVYWGTGFANGISAAAYNPPTFPPLNIRVSNVSVVGCQYYGIKLYFEQSVVDSCTVMTTGSYGIFATTIKNCNAQDCGGDALNADQVADCEGECTGSGAGIAANSAMNCLGLSASGKGVAAFRALNCTGGSTSSYGLSATTAMNCLGNSDNGTGLIADTADNCEGTSNGGGFGLYAVTALNCYGSSQSYYGLDAGISAIGCYGVSVSGTGLAAFIAEVCHGASTSGAAFSVTHNVNSF